MSHFDTDILYYINVEEEGGGCRVRPPSANDGGARTALPPTPAAHQVGQAADPWGVSLRPSTARKAPWSGQSTLWTPGLYQTK
jgi:hypothetical protein